MGKAALSRSLRRQADVIDLQQFYNARVRVYPKAVQGVARQVKWAVLVACLSIYYVVPWLRWDRGPGFPDQMILLDLPHRRFYFAGLVLWPQDIYVLAGGLIGGAIVLFLVTSLFGRLWCGYSCPQTVWTDLFMWVERRIEGDRNQRMHRDQGPLTLDKAWRKGAKHAVWLAVAFWTGGAWTMYYVDAPTAVRAFWTGTASFQLYGFTFLFTLSTYVLGGWAREQVCTYMCPWPRFQSAMLDEQTLTVTYQKWRGEPRGHGKRDAAHRGLGDCVDCGACVQACPTGIDIRDGIQLECINCGLCVDACNEIMERTGQPKWLIKWDTLARQTARAAGRLEALRLLRPRTMVYATVLVLVASAMLTALALRPRQELFAQHDRAPLFVIEPDGSVRDGYTVAVSNKTLQQTTFELRADGLPGAALRLAEGGAANTAALTLVVPPDSVGTFRVLLYGRPHGIEAAEAPVDFVLTQAASGARTVYRSMFLGPAQAP
jgi:cytochrome c oxidase accessory protein FixG